MFSLKDRKSSREEVAKVTATYVNGIAIGVLIVGGIGPIAGRMSTNPMAGPGFSGFLGVGCLIVSGALHWQVRRHLGRELSR